MMSKTVTIERDGRIARLEIVRPPLNILDLATIGALEDGLRSLAQLDDLQLLIVRGHGGRAFSAGVAVEDHTPDRIESMLTSFHGALTALMDLPAVSIAAVEGHCLGGGMELAAACDLVLATDDSRFGQPEIKLGCFPPLAAALYPGRFGSPATFDLLLTGRTLGASEAGDLGLVTRIASRDDFDTRLEELIEEITAHSTAVTQLTKRAIRAGIEGATFEEALATCEEIYTRELVRTSDMQEGLNAFLEKRAPLWNHR